MKKSPLCWGRFSLKVNSFQHFVCQGSDQETGNDTGDQKCRCIIDQSGCHRDQAGDQKLTDIVGDTSCDADAENAESGFLFHQGHDGEAQSSTGQTVQDAEQVSEHKSDDKDTDDGNERGFFPGVFLEDEQDCEIGKSELHSRDSGKKWNQRFHIAEDDSNRGKKPEVGDFFLIHNFSFRGSFLIAV